MNKKTADRVGAIIQTTGVIVGLGIFWVKDSVSLAILCFVIGALINWTIVSKHYPAGNYTVSKRSRRRRFDNSDFEDYQYWKHVNKK